MGLWNNVTNKAYEDGYIVYAMDQSAIGGGAPGGTCFGLAAVWLKKISQGSEYPYDRDAWELHSIDPQAVKVQKIFDAEINKGPLPWTAVRLALEAAGMKLHTGYSQQSEYGVDASGLYNILNRRNNPNSKGGVGAYMVGLRDKAGAAHAMAIINADDTWHLFDANYGRFQVPDKQFYPFMTKYLASGQTKYIGTYNGGWLTAGTVPSWFGW